MAPRMEVCTCFTTSQNRIAYYWPGMCTIVFLVFPADACIIFKKLLSVVGTISKWRLKRKWKRRCVIVALYADCSQCGSYCGAAIQK